MEVMKTYTITSTQVCFKWSVPLVSHYTPPDTTWSIDHFVLKGTRPLSTYTHADYGNGKTRH